MANPNPQSLYYDILEHEVRFARTVAIKAMRLKPFSVWEVLIPIVFILGFMRSRNNRELFVQNFIFTKKSALKGVRDMHAKGLSLIEVRRHLEAKTRKLLDTVDNNVYSEAIRQAQLAEMDLLVSHYNLLYEVEANNFTTRIVSAYMNKEAYMDFIHTLNRAENEVAEAAVQTLGADADTELMARIGKNAATLRQQNAQQYFANA